MSQSQPVTSPNRDEVIAAFLAQAGWGHAERRPLAGDASFRRYDRLFDGNKTAVLMDAPPPKEDIRPFVARTHWLHHAGVSIPNIIAEDAEHGLLLLEDLGDDLFTLLLEKDAADEEEMYRAAMDVLVAFYHQGAPEIEGVIPHMPDKMLSESLLFCDWFLPQIAGKEKAADLREEFIVIWQKLFAAYPPAQHCFTHWDYHAGNLLWLPERSSKARVGVIDYQDGMIGDPAFDVVSLLEDARRDVAPALVQKMLDYYIEQTGIDREKFLLHYALLGAQRNCKIVGIFIRLALRDNKPHYLQFQPRVWGHLQQDISHPALAPLKRFIDTHVAIEHRGVTAI